MCKRSFAALLFLVIGICIFGAAQAYANPGGADDQLVYEYFNQRGVQNFMAVTETVTAPPPCTMPLPTGKNVFTYTPIEAPVVSCDPAKAKPIGVGRPRQWPGVRHLPSRAEEV